MKNLNEFKEVYLYTDFMDMRKDINALSFLAQEEMNADWSKPQLFIFIGKTKKLIKILYYDRTGFALWKKRLEKDRYPWLKQKEMSLVKSLGLRELEQLLLGINIFSMHQEKVYSLIA